MPNLSYEEATQKIMSGEIKLSSRVVISGTNTYPLVGRDIIDFIKEEHYTVADIHCPWIGETVGVCEFYADSLSFCPYSREIDYNLEGVVNRFACNGQKPLR